MSSSNPITRNDWVSTTTGEVVGEEWHAVLEALEANYPDTYDNPQDEIDRPYLLKDDIAWGISETMFDAGQEMAAVSANNNNSPNFYNWYGGRVRTRPVYVQVEFSYRSTLEGSNTDLLTNKQGIFNRTKRKLEAIMTSNPHLLQNKGITWIEQKPHHNTGWPCLYQLWDGGHVQPAFLETLQDNYKWRYIVLYMLSIDESKYGLEPWVFPVEAQWLCDFVTLFPSLWIHKLNNLTQFRIIYVVKHCLTLTVRKVFKVLTYHLICGDIGSLVD